jgi:hypothetical protein
MLKIAFLVLGAILLILIGILEFWGHSDYSPKFSFISPKEYTDLFNDSAKEKTTLYVTNLIKGRCPISEYNYDGNYSVIIYQIDVWPNATLSSLLKSGKKQRDLSFGRVYSILDIAQLNLYYACDSVPISDNIFLTFYGDSAINIFRSDSISCVKLQMDKLFIQNNKSQETDIKLEIRKPLAARIPIEIVFIRRRSGVFLVIISSISETHYLSGDLPQSILNNNFFKK